MPQRKKTGRFEGVMQGARDTYDSARDSIDSAKERAIEAKDKMEDMISEKPFVSIAIAAGVGALVALGVSALLKNRSRDKYRDYT